MPCHHPAGLFEGASQAGGLAMSDNIVDFPLSDRSIDGEDIEL
jgi:hypothetical protein